MITKKFRLLKDDPDTGAILQPLRVLCAYRRDTNLSDSLVRSTPKGSVKLNVNGPSFWVNSGVTVITTSTDWNASICFKYPLLQVFVKSLFLDGLS